MSASLLTNTLAAEEQKLLACVHCGLCLESCPTYTLTGDENDSPRGRIYLMRAVEEGKLRPDSSTFQVHIDRALGCRACEPVCPAGVEYGQLLEASRAELFEHSERRNFSYRILRLVLRHVWLHPARLRFAFALTRVMRNSGLARMILKTRVAKIFSERANFGVGLLASSAPQADKATTLKTKQTDVSGERDLALLFTGCVTAGLFAQVNEATRRVLEINGLTIEEPETQVCCGALHAHAGDLQGARTLARKNIAAFSSATGAPVVTNAGGCGAMLISYAHLFVGDDELREAARSFAERVRDVSQQLEVTGIKQGASISSDRISYDASCHLLNGQRATEAPLKMLRAIPDLNLVPLEGAERCCGGAGVYNMLEPEMSGGVLQEKLNHIQECGAEILTTGNPGCQMQIGAGAKAAGIALRLCHPIELLDESYRLAGMYDEIADDRRLAI